MVGARFEKCLASRMQGPCRLRSVCGLDFPVHRNTESRFEEEERYRDGARRPGARKGGSA